MRNPSSTFAPKVFALVSPLPFQRTIPSLLVSKPLEQVVEPNNLYSASGELFFSGVGVAWIITLACEAWYIDGNELKKRIGYNNVCVGFDMPPASYVAMPVLVISAAMGIAYVWMDTQRGILQKAAGEITQGQYLFTYWTYFGFMISLSLVPLIMVMTPEKVRASL